jgi:hypothetical protein
MCACMLNAAGPDSVDHHVQGIVAASARQRAGSVGISASAHPCTPSPSTSVLSNPKEQSPKPLNPKHTGASWLLSMPRSMAGASQHSASAFHPCTSLPPPHHRLSYRLKPQRASPKPPNPPKHTGHRQLSMPRRWWCVDAHSAMRGARTLRCWRLTCRTVWASRMGSRSDRSTIHAQTHTHTHTHIKQYTRKHIEYQYQ